ncbi:MAG TPA: FxLYD domain-containing protein [Candidatus Paceibacterota bacterium]|nr:FxLYD domain-containing protein [Candidatus Paceibacterota bacterium]
MLNRVQKRFMIGGVYVVIAAAISFGIYWNSGYRPTCSDGIQNGAEEGLDCGVKACGVACAVPVMPVQIQNVQLVETPAGDYDFAARVYNPNPEYGIESGVFDIVITNPAGIETLRIARQSFYMLPGQTKYLVAASLKNIPDGASGHVDIKSIEWVHTLGSVSSGLTLGRQHFDVGPVDTSFDAVITNNSDFDFDRIDVAVLLLDTKGNIIATNVTNAQTISSHTDRYFRVAWPFAVPTGSQVQAFIDTNVFDNSNFLKYHGTQEKFQQFF